MKNSARDTRSIEIWSADWIFFIKKKKQKDTKIDIKNQTYVVRDVVTKKIPIQFLINEGCYNRAIKNIPPKLLSTFDGDDIKIFKIIYNKKLGETNE